MSTNFEDRIAMYTARVDHELDAALPLAVTRPERLHDAMRYAVLNGGKRVRPLLVYATGECLDVDPKLLDVPAVAIELIHAFSLVHDDLPAMDNDDLRRGKPTVHKQYDEATAILAADALQPLAFSVLANIEGAPPAAAIELVRLITGACGSTGMTGGQSIDLAAEGTALCAAELEHMYSLKTGALIHAAVVSACLLREGLTESDAAALDRFGRDIGIAFQIKDDILDVEGETHVIGKPAGSDVSLNKATYPSMLGLEASRRRCDELLAEALASLERFGPAAAPLDWLARYIVERGR
ncbi:MAG: polyprenyl synthetase family protein [Gammaproteobacteria bacterium]|nr:polyprenyl synthetase family protein [Gammaproteobacteria bacterium]MDH5242016.1 polyprenyl synthetase family protein [Gammaproteobacteria bacterium]MDH5261912.1 polyprenyl synthetase family protein [Gammaproteobacteria bacterium]MDH5584608.1 polyprenyl synthetase family protein [Gammaproteobacteria bacterium]